MVFSMLQWYYLALISSVLTGLAMILEKNMLKTDYASAYSASTSVLVALASLVFLPFLKLNIPLENWLLIYIISLLSTIAYLLTARTFRHGTISAASPLNATLPALFTVILAFVFLHEVLTIIQYVGIGITMLAAYLIMFPKAKRKDFESGKYKQLIVMSALLTAISWLIFKYILSSAYVVTYVILYQIFIALNMAVYMSFKYGGVREIFANSKFYKVSLAAIVVLTIGYRLTYYAAVASAPVSLVSPLSNTIIVIMAVFSGSLIFKEGNMTSKVLLSALILLGAFLMII